MSTIADSVGFKLAYNVHDCVYLKKTPVFGITYILQLSCNCYPRNWKIPGIIKMCNKNGNSHLLSDEDKLPSSLTCLWENSVLSFKYFEQCIRKYFLIYVLTLERIRGQKSPWIILYNQAFMTKFVATST